MLREATLARCGPRENRAPAPPRPRQPLTAATCSAKGFTQGVFRRGQATLSAAGADCSGCRPEESTESSYGISPDVRAKSGGGSQLCAPGSWGSGSCAGFWLHTAKRETGSEGVLMVSFSGSRHFLGGSGQVMPEPQGKKRSCKLRTPPAHKTVHPGPFRQLAGHWARRGRRRNTDAWTQSFHSPLQKREEKGLVGPLSRRKQAQTLLLPGGGGPLSPLTVHSVEKGRIPEPQRMPARQRHTSVLSKRGGEGSSRPPVRDEAAELPDASG